MPEVVPAGQRVFLGLEAWEATHGSWASMHVPGMGLLRPWHPVLVPAGEGGSITLVEGREDVLLRVGEKDVVTMRLLPAPGGGEALLTLDVR